LVTSTSPPEIRQAFGAAVVKSSEINTLKALVETGPTPRQPQDIDRLNAEMNELSRLLAPLIPLVYPPQATSGIASMVGKIIKITSTNEIGKITQVENGMVHFMPIRPRTRIPTRLVSSVAAFSTRLAQGEYTWHVPEARRLYLGDTPRRNSAVGSSVKARMANEILRGFPKYRRLPAEQVQSARDLELVWHSVNDCDMSHVIDAVTWWNSNGKLTGAQSPTVLAFMNNPLNYELEPSSSNRSRGAQLAADSVNYEAPVV
jgi:hypothetical protein